MINVKKEHERIKHKKLVDENGEQLWQEVISKIADPGFFQKSFIQELLDHGQATLLVQFNDEQEKKRWREQR